LRTEGFSQVMLWLGGVFQALVVILLLLGGRVWDQPVGAKAIVVYLIALAWLWFADAIRPDWYGHLTQFVFAAVPLLFFALHTLTSSGALTSRRARLLAQRLAQRLDWPPNLADCRTLPEVKAFREALAWEASPALALLQHPRPQVRVAALAALDFRKYWRSGQAERVLRLALTDREPVIRAAAVSALANVDNRALVEQLAEFLRDPAPIVRQAANEALLWDAENRWTWVRHGVRLALADALLQADGALRFEGTALQAETINDLTAWATEKGALGVRAALTLAAYYTRMLTEHPSASLIRHLKEQIASLQAAPALRIELAQLLKNTGELDAPLLQAMLEAGNPGPLRLIAADALLADDKAPNFPQLRALAALRDISRLPNREMALAAADVVQRRLGVDMGLAVGQPLPPLHSRLAADVTRRLMQWASRQNLRADRAPEEDADEEPSDEFRLKPRRKDRGSGVVGSGSGVH
jgi:HEAT repeat protein